MRKLIYGLIVLLCVIHQDFWFWDTPRPLVFGFIPIGLAYQAGISLAAGVLWALAVKYCWPKDVDVFDDDVVAGGPEGGHA